MSFDLQFKESDGVLAVICHGAIYTLDGVFKKVGAAIVKMSETKAKRVLVDDRNLVMSLDALDVNRLADRLESAKFQMLGIRLGCLCRPEDVSTYKMIETAYRNRSINFRLFDNEQAALEWLVS